MPAAQDLDALVREMFEVSTRRSPAWATDLGLRTYDLEVSDPSRARVEEDVRLHQGWLTRAEALERSASGLSASQRVDLAALRYALRLWLYEETEIRTWERNPDLALEFLDHLFGLLVEEERSLEERCEAVAARLAKAPEFLERGRDRFRACPQLWVEMALESAAGAPAMLDAAEKLASLEGVSSGARERVRAAAKEAREAFKGHEDWLRDLRKSAEADGWGIGARRFDTLVDLRMLGATADEIHARGEALVAQLRGDARRAAEALVRAAGQSPGSDPVAQAEAILEEEHPPDWPAVLQAYRDAIAAARAFVERRGLATLPEGERLDVIETPPYLRHILPFAAYVGPGKFERRQVGLYLVTPREPKRFPLAEVLNTTVHEGYPGHHLQLSGANLHPSLARLFVHATETIEGWAHYCEEIMLASGFRAGTSSGFPRPPVAGAGASPEAVRFVVLKDQLWRACRIVIDGGLHRGALSFGDAVAMLRREARMEEPEAVAEVKRYTQSPTYQLSYLWGKIGIQWLREQALRKGLGEREFHDRYLRAGSLPLALMRRELGL